MRRHHMTGATRVAQARPAAKLCAALVAVGLIATGCGGSDDSSGDGSAGDAPAGDDGGTGPTGGTLVMGSTTDPDTLYPWKATQFQAVQALGNIYGTLTELDTELEVIPGLAESWELNDDATALTLHLRQGVTFHDGSDLTSADVKYSLEQIMDESTASVARATLEAVKKVKAPDDLTVVLELSSPDAGLLAGLSSVNLAILSSDDTEQALSKEPNGTGPFTFGGRQPGESLTLTANEDFWDGRPPLDEVEIRIIPDETSIVSALQSGNVQFAVFDDPLMAQSAEGSGMSVTSTPQLSYHALQLRADQAPTDDVNVRLAISCAIDRQEVLDTAALGEGEVVGPITAPAFKSDPAARPCPERDVDKAKEYLAKSDHPDGVTLKTIVMQDGYATAVDEAQSLEAQLSEAGITLDLDPLESGAYVDRWVAGDFDAAVALNGGRPDPDGMYGRYFTSGGNLNQVAGYSSPELDKLFAEGKASTDPDERLEIYAKVSEELENNAAWVWLFTSYTFTVTTPEVSGFTPMVDGSLRFLRETTIG